MARPSPANWGEGEDDSLPPDAPEGPQDEPLSNVQPAAAYEPAAPWATADGQDDADSSPTQGVTELIERALALWHDGHYAASIDAMHEALGTQDLNDAGQALAYWHIYLSEQALGHTARGHDALADFVAVAANLMAVASTLPSEPGSTSAAQEPSFVQQFDLPGRLARARATLNLAWAHKTHKAGISDQHPVLVFNDAEMEHFLELAPPCAKAHDRRVVAMERRQDRLGRATAKATIRCHPNRKDRHYFFAYIGDRAQEPVTEPQPQPQAEAGSELGQ